MSVKYHHRVPESEVAAWVAKGWSIVSYEDSSALRAPGERIAILELAEDVSTNMNEKSE